MEELLNLFEDVTCRDVAFILLSYFQDNSDTLASLCLTKNIPNIVRFIQVGKIKKVDPTPFAYACASGNLDIVKRIVCEGFSTKIVNGRKLNSLDKIREGINLDIYQYLELLQIDEIANISKELLLDTICRQDYNFASYLIRHSKDDVDGVVLSSLFLKNLEQEALWFCKNWYASGREFSLSVLSSCLIPDSVTKFLAKNKIFRSEHIDKIYRNFLRSGNFEMAKFILECDYNFLREEEVGVYDAFATGRKDVIDFFVKSGVKFNRTDPICFVNYSNKVKELLRDVPSETYVPSDSAMIKIFKRAYFYSEEMKELVLEKDWPVSENCFLRVCESVSFATASAIFKRVRNVTCLSLIAAASLDSTDLIDEVLSREIDINQMIGDRNSSNFHIFDCPSPVIIQACIFAIRGNNLKVLKKLLSLATDFKKYAPLLFVQTRSLKIHTILQKCGFSLS